MLTYRIAPHTAPHKVATGRDYLMRDHILARQVSRCPFKIGDDVRVQTNRGKKWGIIDDLIIDSSKCQWNCGTQPFFIAVRVPVAGPNKEYGSEIVYAPLKKVRK